MISVLHLDISHLKNRQLFPVDSAVYYLDISSLYTFLHFTFLIIVASNMKPRCIISKNMFFFPC